MALTETAVAASNAVEHLGPVVAVDVGGTAIKGVVLDPGDRVLARHRWPTPRSEGPAVVVDEVLNAVSEMLDRAGDAAGVGLVVPGLVDDHRGVALYSENIGWHDIPFRDLVVERCGLPVGFGHDVRAGGLAERELGAARGTDDVLFLPIGTGIAGAMYIGGQLVENMYGGEIGHIDVGSGEKCACGAYGCLESIASGAAIAVRYNRATGESVPGAHEVLSLMVAGDVAARTVWGDAVDALARALATYTSLLAPEVVVVGGGLSEAGEALLEPLRRRLRAHLVWQRPPRIVRALLGEGAACLGAGLLARAAILREISGPARSHEFEPYAVARPPAIGDV